VFDQQPHDPPHPDDVSGSAAQLPLFEIIGRSSFTSRIGSVGALGPGSPLPVARYWYRRYLEQSQHPRNTTESYLYDLSLFEKMIGPKPIDEVTARDVASFLGDSKRASTRKRRLTSVSGLFKWLMNSARMIDLDPTESFYPDHIPLKTPRPLFESEQQAVLDAAATDSSRAGLIVWLMLRLGLSRGEVLQLRRDHIDFTEPGAPVVYVFYDNPRWRGKERKLLAGPELGTLYEAFEAEYDPVDVLFVMLPQSVNKMTERVARAAGITKRVTPQTLRDTYAVERARDGADEAQLLSLLGLADDPRNRMSVRRYIKLAAPPVNS
jgi:integrase/recombinase XerD